MEPPYVPGDGVSGDVVGVGEGVDPAWLGTRVVTSTENGGTYAELVLAAESELVAIPDGVGEQAAVVLLHDATTAVQLVDHADVRPGQRVLVTAAAGGAATLVVQLVTAAGAQVVGAARGLRKLERVRELGAMPVDYSAPDWVGGVLELTGGVDVIFDGAGGRYGRAAFGAARDGARIITYGASDEDFAEIDPDEARRRQVTTTGLLEVPRPSRQERKEVLVKVLGEAAAGQLAPTIGPSFPLARAADAHLAVEQREIVGRAVLHP
ncbi:zinc-binding dehydrogenase [Saccharopolyspora rhizosphaerae]|uniref:zinc-binding dehydrogenase n=1 Tax=Saccharopolyspora rhizosphaerae TaxID=2492662 RepID=UPI0018F555BE|nr:zinc-binding dehydrogenase [Saccharopolyspora rhizosphaerae]